MITIRECLCSDNHKDWKLPRHGVNAKANEAVRINRTRRSRTGNVAPLLNETTKTVEIDDRMQYVEEEAPGITDRSSSSQRFFIHDKGCCDTLNHSEGHMPRRSESYNTVRQKTGVQKIKLPHHVLNTNTDKRGRYEILHQTEKPTRH